MTFNPVFFSVVRPPPSPQQLAESFAEEGGKFFKERKFEDALGSYVTASEILLTLYGELHPEVARSLYFIGKTRFELREFDRALECFTKALQSLQGIHGADLAVVAKSLRGRGQTLLTLGRPKEALADLRVALDLFIQLYNCDHREVKETQRVIFRINVLAVTFIFYTYCKALFPDG